jgi:UDP:flavonoid glycosyltransferase YjiC (YdhE family)
MTPPCPIIRCRSTMLKCVGAPSMKFALAMHGTRGDVEPCAAVGLEPRRRHHEVRVTLPLDVVGFVDSARLPEVPYGPNARTMHDEDYADNSWTVWTPISIAAGTPPIYFGFGNAPVRSPTDTFAIISAACTRLDQPALIYTDADDLTHISHFYPLKLIGAVNHTAIFQSSRAIVQHGGAGTVAAGICAGIPAVIHWGTADQPISAAQIKHLKVRSARRFSTTTQERLVADLRRILAPEHLTRAREISTRMAKSAKSATTTADLLEEAADLRRAG